MTPDPNETIDKIDHFIHGIEEEIEGNWEDACDIMREAKQVIRGFLK